MNNFVNKHTKWVFSLPALVSMVAITTVPAAMAFLFSLSDWNLLTGNGMLSNWGRNYPDILTSRESWQSLGIIFYYTIIATAVKMLLGLAITLVPNKDFRGKNGVKVVVLLPYMVAPVAAGFIWILFYELFSSLLSYIFTTIGLPRSTFVPAKQTVIPAIAAVETWQMTPVVVTVCLAGLSSFPVDPTGAARVDGATPIRTFSQVTLPLFTQTLFSVGLLRLVDVLKSFDLTYAMTKGEPANAFRTLNLLVYEAASSYYKFGLSSTMLMILFVIVLPLSVLIVKMQRKPAVYYGG